MFQPLNPLNKHPSPLSTDKTENESSQPPPKRPRLDSIPGISLLSTASSPFNSHQLEEERKATQDRIKEISAKLFDLQENQSEQGLEKSGRQFSGFPSFPHHPRRERAILPSPPNVPAHHFRSIVNQRTTQVKRKPTSRIDVLIGRAKEYYHQEKWDLAFDAAKKARTLAPDNAEALYLQKQSAQNWVHLLNDQADAILLSGQWSEIIKLTDTALEIDPNNIRSYDYKFLALAGQHKWADALQIANAALAIEPTHCRTLCYKALALQKQGFLDDSLDVLDVVLTDDPDNMEALVCKALVLKLLNRSDDLFATLKHKAAVLLKQEKFPEVIETVNAALEVQGFDPQLIDHRAIAELGIEAQANLAQGHCDHAIDTANRIFTIDPNNVLAFSIKCQALLKQHKFQEVIEIVIKTKETIGYEPLLWDYRTISELAIEAQTSLEQGNSDKAIDFANQILSIDQENHFAQNCKIQAMQIKNPDVILIL